MNEEALNTLYSLAKEEGYSKSFDEFKLLMSSNNEAINTMYNVSKNNGYTKTIDDFKVLVGNKKQQADSNPVKKKVLRSLHRRLQSLQRILGQIKTLQGVMIRSRKQPLQLL